MGSRPQTIYHVSTELVKTDKGGKLLVWATFVILLAFHLTNWADGT